MAPSPSNQGLVGNYDDQEEKTEESDETDETDETDESADPGNETTDDDDNPNDDGTDDIDDGTDDIDDGTDDNDDPTDDIDDGTDDNNDPTDDIDDGTDDNDDPTDDNDDPTDDIDSNKRPSSDAPDTDSMHSSDTAPLAPSRAADVGVTSPAGTLVPLYVYPSNNAWQPLIEQKRAHPKVDVVAVVNPGSGPGKVVDPVYTEGIRTLVQDRIQAIGYVSTRHGARDQAEVKKDIDTWATFYPAVTGIFFDEQATQTATLQYYKDVGAYAKTKGYTLTVGNPGTMGGDKDYFSALDIILVYEKDAMPPADEMARELAKVSREQCAISPYDVPTLDREQVQAATKWVKYVYVTNRTYGGDPWRGLPPYLEDLFSALDPLPSTPASP